MLTLNDPRINTASFEQIEYSLPQDKRKGEVVMSFCRLMPQFSKPKRQYKRLYKHVENSTEYYDTYRKDYDRNTTAIVTGAMVLSADAQLREGRFLRDLSSPPLYFCYKSPPYGDREGWMRERLAVFALPPSISPSACEQV